MAEDVLVAIMRDADGITEGDEEEVDDDTVE